MKKYLPELKPKRAKFVKEKEKKSTEWKFLPSNFMKFKSFWHSLKFVRKGKKYLQPFTEKLFLPFSSFPFMKVSIQPWKENKKWKSGIAFLLWGFLLRIYIFKLKNRFGTRKLHFFFRRKKFFTYMKRDVIISLESIHMIPFTRSLFDLLFDDPFFCALRECQWAIRREKVLLVPFVDYLKSCSFKKKKMEF